MAESLKSPRQLVPGAGSLRTLYVVPDDTQAVVSTLQVCNQSADRATFRVSIAPLGAADNAAHYWYWDEPIDGNRAFAITLGITLEAKSEVRVYSSNGRISFNLSRVEKA